MTEHRKRRIDFEGAANFRDLGGYPAGGGRRTRWGRVYRADSLGDLTTADLAKLAGLELRGLVDFRLDLERMLKPDRLPAGAPIRVLELGFLPVGTLEMLARVRSGAITTAEVEREVVSQYRLFVTAHAEPFKRAVAFVADPANHPVLIHCTSGKDRTGFAAAVLLLAVGAPRDVVIDDYLMTNRYRRDVSHLFGPKTQPDVIDILLSAQAHYLEAALDEIDRSFGSFDAYLAKGLEIDEAKRALLYDFLTEA